MNTYRITVQWANGETEEMRIKSYTESKAEIHVWRRGYIKEMNYKILSIEEY